MQWRFEQSAIDWNELSNLYRIAPLGEKKPDDLKLAFSNSRYKCFLFEDGTLTMEHPLADPHWVIRHVLQYGPDAEVLEPPAMRRAVAEAVRAIR